MRLGDTRPTELHIPSTANYKNIAQKNHYLFIEIWAAIPISLISDLSVDPRERTHARTPHAAPRSSLLARRYHPHGSFLSHDSSFSLMVNLDNDRWVSGQSNWFSETDNCEHRSIRAATRACQLWAAATSRTTDPSKGMNIKMWLELTSYKHWYRRTTATLLILESKGF